MILTLLCPPIILYAMKAIVFFMLIIVVFIRAGENTVGPVTVADFNRFVEYLAGTELIAKDKKLSRKIHAEKYRQLCNRTGVNASSAEKFILGYIQRPDEWRKVQIAILAVLDSIK